MREKWSKMLAKLPYHALLDRAVRHVLVAAVAIGGQRGGDMVAHPEQLPKKDRAVGAHVLKTGISIGTGLHTPISVRLRWAPSSDAEPPQKKSLAVQDFLVRYRRPFSGHAGLVPGNPRPRNADPEHPTKFEPPITPVTHPRRPFQAPANRPI